MKKIITILFLLVFIANLSFSDILTDNLKESIGKLIVINIKNSTASLWGKLLVFDDTYLVIEAKVYNPDGLNKMGKYYIRITDIAAIGIADK